MRLGMYRYPFWLKRAVRPVILRLRYAGLRPEDAVLASYPRSGSTWLRFLLLESVTGQRAEWKNVNRLIPYVGGHRRIPPLLPGNRRLVSTHDQRIGPPQQGVLLVRDPRDVALSYFRWQCLQGYDGDFATFLPAFLDGSVTFHGSWAANTRFWLDSTLHRDGGIHVARFEDLRGDPIGTVREILLFLGAAVNDDAIRTAVNENTIARSREKEERAGPDDVRRYASGGHFVGEGQVGAWQTKLTDKQVQRIEDEVGDLLDRLGYGRAPQTAASSPPAR
jgi:hypothetical protein